MNQAAGLGADSEQGTFCSEPCRPFLCHRKKKEELLKGYVAPSVPGGGRACLLTGATAQSGSLKG